MEKLTAQDQEFVREVAITGNQTQAVKKVYGIEDDNYAAVKGTRLLRKDNINTAIEEVKQSIADRLTDDELILKHKEFLNSERPEIGIKALDMGYKLKGSYAAEKNINLNLNGDMTEETTNKANAFDEWYKQQLKGH
jgi:phage terminase small subunit